MVVLFRLSSSFQSDMGGELFQLYDFFTRYDSLSAMTIFLKML